MDPATFSSSSAACAHRPRGVREVEPPAASGAPASVLAIVDDARLRDFLLEVALDCGYGVYCALGALEALCVLGRERPGVVLVDLDMANGAGRSFLNVFRGLRRNDFMLCLAVTSHRPLQLPPGIALVDRHSFDTIGELLARHFDGGSAPLSPATSRPR